jgi:diguanylate cyclase (GGDEF)-like protein
MKSFSSVDFANLSSLSKKLHALYVEDDEKVQEQSIKLFDSFFKSVTIKSNGLEALEAFKENPDIDLIISDIAMPKMDGIEFINEIRELNKKVPIIILSAMNNQKTLTQAIKLGVDGYCLKPIDLFDFSEVLMKIIEKIKLENQVREYEQSLEDKIYEQKLIIEKQYTTDSLTLLPNFNALNQSLQQTLPDGETHILILASIDSFQLYTELYGLEIGNQIIEDYATLLKEYIKIKHYSLFRLSQDKFVLYKSAPLTSIDEYEQDIEKLFSFVSQSKIYIKSLNKYLKLTITLGISFSKEDTLNRADLALAKAQANGRNFIAYSNMLNRNDEIKNNLYWVEEIEKAIEENRVIPFFQPLYNEQNKIVKYEALIRIKQIKKGKVHIVSPEDFLTLSKKTKQYLQLNSIMIQKAIKLSHRYDETIVIKLTYDDIINDSLNRLILDNLSFGNSILDKLELNILNTCILKYFDSHSSIDIVKLQNYIQNLKNIGVKIVIDNFGMNYGDFKHIFELKPDYIRINGKFIDEIENNEEIKHYMQSIMEFAKNIKIQTIITHIETKELYEKALKHNFDLYQGIYLQAPSDKIH